MKDMIVDQVVPYIRLFVSGLEWGTRNWVVIPRTGDLLVVMYRHKRHDVPTPLPCEVIMVTWDELDKPVGLRAEQIIRIDCVWPIGTEPPDLS